MTDDIYMIAITALLPLVAVVLVLQTNPYQALVIRGILGAIAALVYAMFGAADVALTEALVGTMLSITLYAIAVRSSMTLRVGIFDPYCARSDSTQSGCEQTNPIACVLPTETLTTIKQTFSRHHIRVETLSYPNRTDLEAALHKQEIHLVYYSSANTPIAEKSSDSLLVRTQQLCDILRPQLSEGVSITLVEPESALKNKTQPIYVPGAKTS